MKAKRIITWLVSICMILTMLPAVGTFAADDEITVLLDTTKKASITKAGFTADSKNVSTTKYSAKWDTGEDLQFVLPGITDISMHDTVNFSIMAESDEESVIMLYVGSENPSTDGTDYYSKVINLKPGEWQTLSIPYSDIKPSREPLGFDKVTEFKFTAKGWSNKVAEGTKIYIENICLSGKATASAGDADDAVTEVLSTLFSEDAPVGETIHYNSAGFESKGQKPGGSQKTNKFEIASDSGDNHYLLCETLDSESDYHWDLSLASPTRYMVFDFDISTATSLPRGSVMYKDSNNESVPGLITFGGDWVKLKDGKEVKLEAGEWNNIAIVCDFLKNTHSVYVNGEKKIADYKFSDKPSISMVRFYFNRANEVGTSMMIDNLKIYEGAEPREVANEVYRVPKITMDSNAAKNQLGGVVALSVGGNGVCYGGEKHAIDAPAYVDNGRTLIPVRAVSEAFGLDVAWDDASRTVTVDGKSKIVIDSTQMVLPNGSTYTLDVPAKITNGRTFIPLRALCEQILGKVVTWNDKGIIVISESEFEITDSNANVINNYLLYDRPTKEQISELFNSYNKNTHPRVMMNKEIYDRVVYNYANDPDVKAWGDKIISAAEAALRKELPTYSIPDGKRLLATSREVYSRAQNLSMAYILTKDAKYAEGLYKVYQAAGSFPDWNYTHFLDVGEMTGAFAIGYDWLYDYWSEEQKTFLAETIYGYGLLIGNDAYYNNLGSNAWWVDDSANWNVVCNGGLTMGAVAVFDRYPEMCSDMIAIAIRGVESMMNSFYPDGAWFEGVGYWDYTLSYSVNMFSTLEACFGTDFNLTKAPGFANTIYFHMGADGNTYINNFHDAGTNHGSTDEYFWLSNKFNLPGATNVRLSHFNTGVSNPAVFDLLWYDTSIKGTDFYLPKDAYLRDVEFVSMRNSWVDTSGAWLSYHGGKGVINHSHLDTGSFVFDLAGIRWAQDLGSDDYNLPGYFGAQKHEYYRLRPEGHNVYVIDPDNKEGQTLDHFAQVESLVSKEKGAYSVLDLTPAYSTWVNKARRGYMLTDDRRSGVIRDEIEFNKAGREFWWFMHTPKDAEIEIVDKNTAYITSKGVTLKFMIDSDIEGYELGVMDAKPLEKSPNNPSQNQNTGIKKLYLKGIAGTSNYVECKMILADDPRAELPLSKTKIDDWSIPDGPMQEIPVLDMISVNGVDIEGFMPTNVSYGRTIRFDDTSTVNITARAAAGLGVEVTPGATYADPITIKVYYENDPNTYRKYVYTTTILPELVDVGEYDRMQIVGHSASDEPESNHPATNVSNNDIDPESRWAAQNNAWLVLDMGKEEVIDAVGISAWKGGERIYTFKIEVSSDGVNWTEVISERGTDTANGESIGIYPFTNGAVSARYVRYTGSGNSTNAWNSLMELAALKKK